MALYDVYVCGYEDPGNDVFDRLVEMTEQEAAEVRRRLEALRDRKVIYNDYRFAEARGSEFDARDLNEFLDTMEVE